MKEIEAELRLIIYKDMQHKVMYQFVFLVIITSIHSQSQAQTNNNQQFTLADFGRAPQYFLAQFL